MLNLHCVICLDNIINIYDKSTLKCEHSFHKTCINKYFGTSCPLCKQEFISSNIYYINIIDNRIFTNIILLKNPIIKKLNRFFILDHVLQFLNLLNLKILLSGQLLLSIIQNSNEIINDLDIYIDDYYEYKIMKNFLQNIYYKPIHKPITNEGNTNEENIQFGQISRNNSINYLSLTDNQLSNNNDDIIVTPSIYKIKTYTSNGFNINLIYNVNNLYVIQNNIKLDILKNYFDGNYFHTYNTSKLELQIDYVNKDKLTTTLKNIILYYRNIGYNIYITE